MDYQTDVSPYAEAIQVILTQDIVSQSAVKCFIMDCSLAPEARVLSNGV